MDFQEFLIYLVITVLMSPLLIVMGIPFIIVAKIFHRVSARWMSAGPRFVLACGIATLGIAPAYDMHRMPTPIYTWLMAGDPVSMPHMLFSFAITWLVILLQTHKLAGKRVLQPARPR
ncbi:MAG TPA: hypothetical protein VLR44_03425 [Rhodoferax sp.]|nr:hypothetical protein [Rhodoferax sp.]